MPTRAADSPSVTPSAARAALGDLVRWMTDQGWRPHEFQQAVWEDHLAGGSGLVHVPTGAGKTYAAYFGPLAEMIAEARAATDAGTKVTGPRTLYLTPLRAVSRDVEKALTRPAKELGVKIRVETRTGDTSSYTRKKQRAELPQVLITTPESLSLLLTYPEARERFQGLHSVVLDEWHELLASKRGVQTELAIARLRAWLPNLRTRALSATLSNLDEAAQSAVGAGRRFTLTSARMDRPVHIETLIPDNPGRFPWAGHLGLKMLPDVLASLDAERSTLIFCNTRSQAERWFHAIEAAKPEWRGHMGLHHGSIDRDDRTRTENGLKDGSVRLVVATSSLDLGVDFAPVERVYQIGSPKGVARLMQRAGRASHRPGEPCHIVCVPTHALELVEIAAVRRAIAAGEIEPRRFDTKPLDVLAQHMVTCALGGGFDADAFYAEVRGAQAYADLTREDFDWTLRLVTEGGGTLAAYPEYRKVTHEGEGRHAAPEGKPAQLHRLNIGTITGDATMEIRFVGGKRLGSIEEHFVGKLRVGERFVFAGRVLRFHRAKDLTCFVRPATGRSNHTPIWSGTRLPISESLAEGVRSAMGSLSAGDEAEPEFAAAAPIIEAQSRLSHTPSEGELLVESCETREGSHLFVYPFEGRLVNLGIASLAALRLGRRRPATFTIAANDYGFELLCERGEDFAEWVDEELFTSEQLMEDISEAVNVGELSKRQFREVARVSGLVFQSYPGAHRSMRQLHASSSLLYDVLTDFDPDNLLLAQARREVLDRQFERSRLARTLARLASATVIRRAVKRPTPLGLPLVIERVGGQISSETLEDRIARATKQWEADLRKAPKRERTT
ncbi:MAG: ligase-associated DNA damage response DEXH box helicase [Planctomycetota bacterium]